MLADWLALQPPDPEARDRLRGRLLLALEELDRADITTIHGFCRRTLQRRALEAGLGPAVELENDDGERSRQVCHDYWQQQVLALPPELLAGLQSRGLGPQRLQKLLGQLDGDPALELDALPAAMAADQPLAAQLHGPVAAAVGALCEGVGEHGAALEAELPPPAGRLEGDRHPAKTTPYPPNRRQTGRPGGSLDRLPGDDSQQPGWSCQGGARAKALLRDYFHPAAPG